MDEANPKFDASLNVRVPQSERDRFEQWCEKACVSPASLIRQCMRSVVEYRAEELELVASVRRTNCDRLRNFCPGCRLHANAVV